MSPFGNLRLFQGRYKIHGKNCCARFWCQITNLQTRADANYEFADAKSEVADANYEFADANSEFADANFEFADANSEFADGKLPMSNLEVAASALGSTDPRPLSVIISSYIGEPRALVNTPQLERFGGPNGPQLAG